MAMLGPPLQSPGRESARPGEVTMEWIVARLQWGYTIPPIGGHFG